MIKDIPQLGFGTWLIEDKEILKESIGIAIANGYTHIDTAQVYNNEFQIGEVLKELKVDRKKLFITSKISPMNFKYYTYQSIEESLRRLQVDMIDLMLLHAGVDDELNVIAYKELIKAREKGLIRHVGVSNFSIAQIENIKAKTNEYPYINQIIVAPSFRAVELEEFCKSKNIKLTGYSIMKCFFEPNPFFPNSGLNDEEKKYVLSLGKKYEKDAGQILNRWAIQHDYTIIPKSSKADRVISNAQIFDFKLNDDEMKKLDSFNRLTSDQYAKIIKQWGASLTEDTSKKGLLFDKNFARTN